MTVFEMFFYWLVEKHQSGLGPITHERYIRELTLICNLKKTLKKETKIKNGKLKQTVIRPS